MTSCIKCGGAIGEFDAGGDMICQNCESSAGGSGMGKDVPCQRCGMYLPSHELRMHNSRLYCAYCIMDVQDEEKYAKGRGSAGSEAGRLTGICERCGRETDTLYSVQGRRLCSSCHSAGSPGGADSGGTPMLSLIVERVAGVFGVRKKPNIVPTLPPGKIGIRAPSAQEDKERQKKSLERFNLKERRMMEEEEGQLGETEPLSEGHRKEKKPSPEARKKFFPHLGGGKKD